MLDIEIVKKLDSFELNLSFKSDEKLLAIVGESGSGKTTLLRILAGLETIDKGYIKVDNNSWENLPIQKRDVGVVLQNYALFPNMSVWENLFFAKEDKKKIEELLHFLELEKLKDRYPERLSGGEKQRVAIARALLLEPKLLLLDEPFSALNFELKDKLYQEIEKIKERFDIQIVLISHDLSEVYRLADRVIEIRKGKIVDDFIPSPTLLNPIYEDSKRVVVKIENRIYEIKKG